MRSARSALLFLLVLTGLAALQACGGDTTPSASPTVAPNSGVEDRTERQFAVSGAPTVVANTFRGEIQVAEGALGVIDVQLTKVAYLPSADAARTEFANIAVSLTQDGNTVRVMVTQTASLDSRTVIRLRLAVPATTALELSNALGSIVMNDLEGAKVWAQVASGSITFSGSLSESGHSLRVTSGSIKMALPNDAAFTLDASVGTGSVKSDFTLSRTERSTTSALKGDVGIAPRTTITMSVGSGSIALISRAGGG